MRPIEDVVRGIEQCLDPHRREEGNSYSCLYCPYRDTDREVNCRDEMVHDAITCLRETDAKIHEMADMIDRLENRIYNLSLYLDHVREFAPAIWDLMEKKFDGLPGYLPATNEEGAVAGGQ